MIASVHNSYENLALSILKTLQYLHDPDILFIKSKIIDKMIIKLDRNINHNISLINNFDIDLKGGCLYYSIK